MAAAANTVSISTNLNVNPYYDDYSEAKNFHRVLFRPGLAVQARELTQMQSILQSQIDRFAEHVFKEGSVVRGCQVNYDQQYTYLKLRNNDSTGTAVNVYTFSSTTIKGTTSGVRAYVVNVNDGAEANTPAFKTLFVKYIGANTNGNRFFSNNEIISAVGTAYTANTIKSAQGAAGGFGSAVTVTPGIIFAKDHFIRVEPQTLILEKYSANSSYKVGFDVVETIVTENSDSTLLDPASGSYNYTAPGAARLKIVPTLAKKTLTSTTANNFVELMQIDNGVIQRRSDAPQYADLKDYIARRTAEQTGDFVVSGLSIRLSEHLRSGNNNGLFSSTRNGNTSLLGVSIEPGKAYVRGYDIEKLVTTIKAMDKGIDYKDVSSAVIYSDYGNYVICDNVVGEWDLNLQGTVSLRDTQANAISTKNYSTTTYPGAAIGTARVKGFEYYSGVPGSPQAQYKLYLGDIRITTAGKSFANVQAICSTNGATANGKADIVGATGTNAAVTDGSFDRAVFTIPAKNIRRLRSSAAAVTMDWDFYKSFNLTLTANGTVTLNTSDATETLDGSGVLSTSAARQYYVVSRASSNTNNLSGTVSTTNSSNVVTGSGTLFTTQLNVGDLIRIANTGIADLIVSSISSTTSLTTLSLVAGTRTAMPYFKKIKSGTVFDMGGYGKLGARTVTVSSTTTSALALKENFSGTVAATALVKLNKINGQEASKTINRSRYVQIRIGNAAAGTSYAGNTTGPWPLGLSDGFKLISVRRKTSTNFTTLTDGNDISTNFILDSGMRDTIYDHAQLKLKPGVAFVPASGDRYLVKLDYFTHVSGSPGTGYMSVDSYPVNDSTAGTDTTKIYTYQIPVYVSPRDGKKFDLRDSLDLRPRITDTANSVTAITGVSVNPLTSTTLDQPSGGLRFPPPATQFGTDLSYYLKRSDLVAMNSGGSVLVIRGTPAEVPVTPEPPRDYMAMARIAIAPYPSLPDEIGRQQSRPDLTNAVVPIRNERYTMRDIGALRDRIDRLEYYTALNLLEKNAKDMKVPDSAGLDRFKNGILVDSFTGHSVGNVYDIGYKCAIDAQKGELRPLFKLDKFAMNYNAANSSSVSRTNVTVGGVSRDQTIYISNSQVIFSNNEVVTCGAFTGTLRYQVNNKLYVEAASGTFSSGTVTGGTSGKTATTTSFAVNTGGDLVTFPYTHYALIEQKYATTSRNAAGTSYNWNGMLTLDPDGDYWQDTTQQPDVQINFDFGADNWLNMQKAWGTQWNDWQTVSTGQSVVGSRETVTGTTISDGKLEVQTQREDIIETTENQTRSGSKLNVSVYTKEDRVGNRVKDVNIIGFMRSIPVKFTGKAFKPSTRLYAYFDNINVTGYITPTSSAFANTANEGATLTSDSSGNVYGIFRIPSNGSLKFRTGQKMFRLTDNLNNTSGIGLTTSAAEAVYTASGLNVQNQDTLITTRGAQVSTETVSSSRSVSSQGSSISGVSSTSTDIPQTPSSPPTAPTNYPLPVTPVSPPAVVNVIPNEPAWEPHEPGGGHDPDPGSNRD